MKLVRCENGHFYYAELNDVCPHCNAAAAPDQGGAPPVNETPTEEIDENFAVDKSGFVVGWLVAVEGKHYGDDFKLVAGDNTIGRFADMDIKLVKDIYISRKTHAVVFYDDKINEFDMITLGKTKLMFVACCSKTFNWNM